MLQRNLANISYLKAVLGRAGITPTRSAGQNFLICEEVVEATLVALQSDVQQVTELGAGLGTLTQGLAAHGFQVRAIERDKGLADILIKQLPRSLREKVEVVVHDLREVDWIPPSPKATASEAYSLVGNIPYNLSGWIMRQVTHLVPAPERVVFLVQREVADRILAVPPDMNLLGLSIQLWGEPQRLLNIPASCFWPQPEVDSSLVAIVPDANVAATLSQREQVLKVAKVFFQAKRKQLGGVLKRAYSLREKDVKTTLAQIGTATVSRPQELSVAQWQELAKRLY